MRKIPRDVARAKTVRAYEKNCIVFSTMFSPHGPDISGIIKTHQHLLQLKTPNVFPENSIMVAHKRGKNLKDLMVRGDPYNIKSDLTGGSSGGYLKCGQKCD